MKTIQLGKQEERRFYELYVENDHVFYRYHDSRIRQGKFETLDIKLTRREKAWLNNPDDTADNKLLSGLLEKLQQDENVKAEALAEIVAKEHKALFGSAVPKAVNRLGRPLRDDKSTQSSDSSVLTNPSTGSFKQEIDHTSSSTRRPATSSNLPPEDINSMEVEPPSRTDTSRTPSTPASPPQDLSRSNSLDPWSGRSVNFSGDGGDDVSELGNDEFSQHMVTEGAPSTPHSPPTLPIDDHNALYHDLQVIVNILAQLKGNEPQLESVRQALNKAIEKTGGKVSPIPEATVEPLSMGATGAGTSSRSEAYDIEENIRLLQAVQGKLARLLEKHGEKMEPELQEALVQLQKVVKNSITEANKIKNTRNFREQAASGRSESGIPLSRMNTDTQTWPGGSNDTSNDGYGSTPTKN